MCSPGLAIQGVGAATSAIGSFAEASMQRSALRSQARLNEINAKLADAGARAEVAASVREQMAIKLRGANVKGAQRAAIAAGGVDLSSASAQAALATTDYFTEADAIQAEANGVRAAWGRRIEAGNLRRGATSARATAAGISPFMAATTSLLGSASQLSSSWDAYKRSSAGASTGPSGGGWF